MIWDIVTFSNTPTLNMVMNAIASIFSDGGYKAAAASLMLFVVAAAALADMVKGGKELSFGKLLAGFVIYTAGFSTLTSVSIENRFDGTVEKVDNIPIAVAVPASLISNIGLWFAETSETAFTPLNYTDIYKVTTAGYMTPLKTLVHYRDIAMNNSCAAGPSNSVVNNINLCKSVPYFVAECSMVGLDKKNSTESLYQDEFLDTLRFDSKAHATVLFDGSGNQTVYDCQTASDMIIAAFNSSDYGNYLNNAGVIDYAKAANIPLIDVTEDIFAPNVTYQSGQGRSFMIAMFNHQLAEDGQYAYYSKTGAQDIAENLNSSIQQRNYGWAMQGEMWYELVDKFISILEALIYALAPFIGLMLITGTLGQKTFLLYLQMLAIIQLIPTMLVVTQSVVLHDFNQQFLALSQDKNLPEGSVNYAMALTSLALDKMGIGGMMAATVVPGMAMALVTGSGMALMGSFKGAAAAAKDVDAMPETHGQGGAIHNLGQMNTANVDRYNNAMTQSSQQTMGEVQRSLKASNNISQAKADMQSARESYNNTLTNAFETSTGKDFSTEQAYSAARQLRESSSAIDQWATNQVSEIASGMNLSSEQTSQLKDSVVAQAQFGVGAGADFILKVKGEAGVGASSESAMTESDKKALSESFKQATTGTAAKTFSDSYEDAKSYAESNSQKYTTGNRELDKQLDQISHAKEQVYATQEEYKEASSLESALSIGSGDMNTLINYASQDDSVKSSMNSTLQEWRESDRDAFVAFTRDYDEQSGGVNANSMNDEAAKLSAFIMAAQESGNISDIREVLSQYNSAEPLDATEMSSLTNTPINNQPTTSLDSETREKIENIASPTRGSVENSVGRVQSGRNINEEREASELGNDNANRIAKEGFNSDSDPERKTITPTKVMYEAAGEVKEFSKAVVNEGQKIIDGAIDQFKGNDNPEAHNINSGKGYGEGEGEQEYSYVTQKPDEPLPR